MTERIVSVNGTTVFVRMVAAILMVMYGFYVFSPMNFVPFLGTLILALVAICAYAGYPYFLENSYRGWYVKISFISGQLLLLNIIYFVTKGTGNLLWGIISATAILSTSFLAPWNVKFSYMSCDGNINDVDKVALLKKLKKYSRSWAWVYRLIYVTIPLKLTPLEIKYLQSKYPYNWGFTLKENIYYFPTGGFKNMGHIKVKDLIRMLEVVISVEENTNYGRRF